MRVTIAGEKSAGEITARARCGTFAIGITVAKIRHRSKATAAREAHPGAAEFEIASGVNVRMVLPERRSGGRARVGLVAIARDYQRVLGACFKGE